MTECRYCGVVGVQCASSFTRCVYYRGRSPSQRPLRLSLKGVRSGVKKAIKFAGQKVLIWSGEHLAWWRPNAAGYTTVRENAGVYLFEDAYDRTRHCGPEKKIEYYLDGRR
jgi:hypothetical protein